ncbi:hypothetical protein [Rugamonas violacea]|uniref:hypothetical protein n=1 Tax=Rugamonas sp. CCM 8940 TaxID=2765359 RepID=UPI00366AC5B6
MDVDPFHSGIKRGDLLRPSDAGRQQQSHAGQRRQHGALLWHRLHVGRLRRRRRSDGDGTLIMSGHLIFNEASFTFSSIPASAPARFRPAS